MAEIHAIHPENTPEINRDMQLHMLEGIKEQLNRIFSVAAAAHTRISHMPENDRDSINMSLFDVIMDEAGDMTAMNYLEDSIKKI